VILNLRYDDFNIPRRVSFAANLLYYTLCHRANSKLRAGTAQSLSLLTKLDHNPRVFPTHHHTVLLTIQGLFNFPNILYSSIFYYLNLNFNQKLYDFQLRGDFNTYTHTTGSKLRCQTPTKHTTNISEPLRISVKYSSVLPDDRSHTIRNMSK